MGSLNLRIHENLASVKRITFSLIIVSLVISISVPVYAPFNIGPGKGGSYIDHLPLAPVANLQSVEPLIVTSVASRRPGQTDNNIIAILIRFNDSGVVNYTEIDSGQNDLMDLILNMTLNMYIDDDEGLTTYNGNFQITMFSTQRTFSFRGIVNGNGSILVPGISWGLNLHLIGTSAAGSVLQDETGYYISLDMQGSLSKAVTINRIDFEWDLGDGLIDMFDGQILMLNYCPPATGED